MRKYLSVGYAKDVNHVNRRGSGLALHVKRVMRAKFVVWVYKIALSWNGSCTEDILKEDMKWELPLVKWGG